MKKALLIADSPGWAYDIEAKSIQRHSESFGWKSEIKYVKNLRRRGDNTDLGDYDAIFWLFWYHALSLGPRLRGFDYGKSAVLVSSHVGWEKRGIAFSELKHGLELFPAVGTSSKMLLNEINIPGAIQIPHGIDRGSFRFSIIKRSSRLKLMWVGNPDISHHGDLKGFKSIVEPVVSSFQKDQVELITATPKNFVPHEKMPDFYKKGDILIVTSKSEGNPMPLIESMHSGRPVISTNVGVVSELIKHRRNGWIIDRDRTSLRSAIEDALKSRRRLAQMGVFAKLSVLNRTGKKKAGAVFRLLERCA